MEEQTDTNFFIDVFNGIGTLLQLGGPVVWILLLASVLGLALALVKFLQFSKAGAATVNRLEEGVDSWLANDKEKAAQILNGSQLEIGKDLAYALEQRSSADADQLQDELFRRGAIFLRQYSRNLRPLEMIYYLAPVMGLLGTVLGMIDAFRGLAVSAGAAGESSALASGIWEALLTTAVGLSIAIPFAVMHATLESRLELLTEQIGDLMGKVLSVE